MPKPIALNPNSEAQTPLSEGESEDISKRLEPTCMNVNPENALSVM
jgi:hypothetical protein